MEYILFLDLSKQFMKKSQVGSMNQTGNLRSNIIDIMGTG